MLRRQRPFGLEQNVQLIAHGCAMVLPSRLQRVGAHAHLMRRIVSKLANG